MPPNTNANVPKRRFSDVSEPDFNQENMENIIFGDLDFDCDSESPTEGSDKEARYFSADSESDAEGQQPDIENPQHDTTCGTPIREHLFPEQDSGFNLYGTFRNPINYYLARFLKIANTYKKKIQQFFQHDLLKRLNPTHQVQFG